MRITDQHSATLTAPLRSDRPRIGADLRAEIGEPGGPKTTRSRRRVRIGIVLDVTAFAFAITFVSCRIIVGVPSVVLTLRRVGVIVTCALSCRLWRGSDTQ